MASSTITVTVKFLTGDLIQIDDFDASTGIRGLAMRLYQIDKSLDSNWMNFFRESAEEKELQPLYPRDEIHNGDLLHLLIAERPQIIIRQDGYVYLYEYDAVQSSDDVYRYVILCKLNNEIRSFISFYVSASGTERYYPENLFKTVTTDDSYEQDYKIEALNPSPLPFIPTLEEYIRLYHPHLPSEYIPLILEQWRLCGSDQSYNEYKY
jgi:hypothetical protein